MVSSECHVRGRKERKVQTKDITLYNWLVKFEC